MFMRHQVLSIYVQYDGTRWNWKLFIAFNQLKEKLHKEGLFNPNFKQPIPRFPKTIGVFTATTGAAIRDICTTIKRRYPISGNFNLS